MKSFLVTIYSKPHYNKSEDIEFIVEFLNKNKKPVYISSDIAAAFENEELKKEKGTNTRRKRFFKVAPQKSVLKKVNLGKSISATAGEKDLTFALPQLEAHYRNTTGKRKTSKLRLKGFKQIISIGKVQKEPVYIIKSADKSFGFNEPMIDDYESAEAFMEYAAEEAYKCSFIGGTSEQQQQMEEAHQTAFNWSYEIYRTLSDNDNYRRWFGTYTPQRFDDVKKTLSIIVDNLQNKKFTYDIREEKNGMIIGSAQYNKYTIVFYNIFWRLKNKGENTKAGQIIHEQSHVATDTRDYEYGYHSCLELAESRPDKAIKNADSFRLFSENYFQLIN